MNTLIVYAVTSLIVVYIVKYGVREVAPKPEVDSKYDPNKAPRKRVQVVKSYVRVLHS